MEKRKNNKTITIKINGKDRPIEEETINSNRVPAKKATNNKKKDEPSQKKIVELYEKIEESTANQSAAAQEERDEDNHFDWVLPEMEEQEDVKEYKFVNMQKSKSKKFFPNTKNPFKQRKEKGIIPSILFTVLIAVLFGTGLGITMLQMIKLDGAKETTATSIEETRSPIEDSPPGTETIELSPITGYLIQGGAYSTIESAKEAEAEITQKGVSTTLIQMEDKAYIFVGLADNLENAKDLGGQIESKGVEIYAREVSLGGGTKTELQEVEKGILEQAPTMFETIASISVSGSLSNSISPELSEKLKSQTTEWGKLDDKAVKDESIEELKIDIDAAITELKNFEENSDQNQLMKVQQHLLNFLTKYHEL